MPSGKDKQAAHSVNDGRSGPPPPLRSASPSPPSLGTQLAGERSQRLQRHLSEALRQPVEISVAASYETLARELASGQLGAAWAPPFVCARVENMGVRVLVRGVRK